jgi:hypothetical protein
MSRPPETLRALLADLDASDPARRDLAALRLRDFALSAVEALFRAVARPANRDHRGTLVHALSAFACRDRFPELFDLALHGNYEVQCHALSLLRAQTFSPSAQQRREAERALAELRERDSLTAEDVEHLRGELTAILARSVKGTGAS